MKMVPGEWHTVVNKRNKKFKMVNEKEGICHPVIPMVDANQSKPAATTNDEILQPIIQEYTTENVYLRLELLPEAGNSTNPTIESLLPTINSIMVKIMGFQPDPNNKTKLLSIDNKDEMSVFSEFTNPEELQKYFHVYLRDMSNNKDRNTVIFQVERSIKATVWEMIKHKPIKDAVYKKAYLRDHRAALGKMALVGSIYLINPMSLNVKSFEKDYNEQLKEHIKDNPKFSDIEVKEDENIVEISSKFTKVFMEKNGQKSVLRYSILDVKCTKGRGRKIVESLIDANLDKDKYGLFVQSTMKETKEINGLIMLHHQLCSESSRIILNDIPMDLLMMPISELNGIEDSANAKSLFNLLLTKRSDKNNEIMIRTIVEVDNDRNQWLVNTTVKNKEEVYEFTKSLISKLISTMEYADYNSHRTVDYHIINPISEQNSNDRAIMLERIASNVPETIMTGSMNMTSSVYGSKSWRDITGISNQSNISPSSSVSSLESQISVLKENYSELVKTVKSLTADLLQSNSTIQELTDALSKRDKQMDTLTSLFENQRLQHKSELKMICDQIAQSGLLFKGMKEQLDTVDQVEKRHHDEIAETPPQNQHTGPYSNSRHAVPPMKQQFQQYPNHPYNQNAYDQQFQVTNHMQNQFNPMYHNQHLSPIMHYVDQHHYAEQYQVHQQYPEQQVNSLYARQSMMSPTPHTNNHPSNHPSNHPNKSVKQMASTSLEFAAGKDQCSYVTPREETFYQQIKEDEINKKNEDPEIKTPRKSGNRTSVANSAESTYLLESSNISIGISEINDSTILDEEFHTAEQEVNLDPVEPPVLTGPRL